VDGSNVQRLTTNGTEDLLPAWSPDGTQIAFFSKRSGNGDIYKMNAVPDAAQIRLTSGTAGNRVDTEPAWFGNTIAFATNRHGDSNYEIYTMDTNGGAQTRRTQQPGHDVTPAWSVEGAKLAFASNRTPPGGGNNYNIFTMEPNGSGQTPLVTHGAADQHPDW
jgi:Tol biopolymer transport system component